ncbi:MAG: hypothetical protein AVDCRST_MAG66-592, partial [uncultured Pseudonocardia sp.]
DRVQDQQLLLPRQLRRGRRRARPGRPGPGQQGPRGWHARVLGRRVALLPRRGQVRSAPVRL